MTWRMHDKYREMPPAAGQASSAGSGGGGQGGARGSVTLWPAGPPPGLTRVLSLCHTGLPGRASLGREGKAAGSQRGWLEGQREEQGSPGHCLVAEC